MDTKKFKNLHGLFEKVRDDMYEEARTLILAFIKKHIGDAPYLNIRAYYDRTPVEVVEEIEECDGLSYVNEPLAYMNRARMGDEDEVMVNGEMLFSWCNGVIVPAVVEACEDIDRAVEDGEARFLADGVLVYKEDE
jgi:hypothetical protein